MPISPKEAKELATNFKQLTKEIDREIINAYHQSTAPKQIKIYLPDKNSNDAFLVQLLVAEYEKYGWVASLGHDVHTHAASTEYDPFLLLKAKEKG